MLRKLLKYDLKWCYKPLIVFYGLALFFSVITRVVEQFPESVIFMLIDKICCGIVIVMLINILINNFIRAWVRFIKNLYKDESYLTHTLPVHKNTIFLAKILTAIITMLTSAVVILVCLVICYGSEENWQMFQNFMEQTALLFDCSVVSFVVTMVITLFFQSLFVIFVGYFGIIIGYRANQFKLVKSIVIGFFAYVVPCLLTLGVMYGIGIFDPEVMKLFQSVSGFSMKALKTLLWSGIALYLIYDIVYYLLGKKILEKGVNVD